MIAVSLWCFSPSIIANAQLMTPDIGATSLGVLAAFTFSKWLQEPDVYSSSIAGFTLGLALSSKATCLVLLMIWPPIMLMYVTGAKDVLRRAFHFAWIITIAVVVVNCIYGFEDWPRRFCDLKFASKALSELQSHDSWIGQSYSPLPTNYVLGIDTQLVDFEQRLDSYLGGTWKRGGWWYYYVYGFAVKSPIGTLILTIVAACTFLTRTRTHCQPNSTRVVSLHFLAIVLLVSSETGFSHHMRYILPASPYGIILLSRHTRLVSLLGKQLVCCCLVGSAVSSLFAFPHSLSYFNEAAGGPAKGAEFLNGSNFDWGQDLERLLQWAEDNPNARPLTVAYSIHKSLIEPGDVGLSCTSIDAFDSGEFHFDQGYFVLFRNPTRRNLSRYFDGMTPIASIGYTIAIYKSE
jgi:hypothetical protein